MTSPVLPPAVPGDRREVNAGAGRLAYYVAGNGPPTLLLHSINAAAAAHEVRPLFEDLRPERRVYAPDLPGFGFSDRSDRTYDVALYVQAVRDMLDVIAHDEGTGPVDVLALSLSSEFAARVATERPERFRTLALVTPTGFSKLSERRQGTGTMEIPGLHGFFSFPLWSKAFFGALTSRASVRYFLQRTYGSKEIDPELHEYAWLTAHQPGAERAPFAFVSGRLFSKDVRSLYGQLSCPVWVPHATRGDFKDFRAAPPFDRKPNWRFQPFPTGAMVYFEQRAAFLEAYRAFLAEPVRFRSIS